MTRLSKQVRSRRRPVPLVLTNRQAWIVQSRAPRRRTSAVGDVEVFPLVLEFPLGGPIPRQSLAAGEGQPSEHEARHGLVDGPVVVDAAFDSQQLREQRGVDRIRGRSAA